MRTENKKMRPDIQFIERKAAEFNKLCFGGELPPIPVKLASARTFLGKVTYKRRRGLFRRDADNYDFTLRISSLYDISEQEWEDIVIHELIHYYIAYHNLHDSSAHGRRFRSMMAEINAKYGRNISIRHHGKEGELPMRGEKIRTNYLCVSQLEDGKWGITVCAEKKIFEIRRNLPRYYKLSSMNWYASNDTFFNRYPRSRKGRIYKIRREDLDVHLAGAQSYIFKGKSFEPFSGE